MGHQKTFIYCAHSSEPLPGSTAQAQASTSVVALLRTLCCLIVFFCFAYQAHAVTYRYLDIAATGVGDGTSWNDAWTNFSDALTGAAAPAITDDVIVYVRDGHYLENTSNSGHLRIAQEYAHQVTFRHDPEDASPDVVVQPLRTGSASASYGTQITGATSNLAFEAMTFQASQKVLNNADSIDGFSDSADTTVSLNNTIYDEGTGAINVTKDGTSSTLARTSVVTATMYHGAGSNVSMSLYVANATALMKLASSDAFIVRVGSDDSNYYQTAIMRSSLSIGWNHLWGYPKTSTVGTPVNNAIDYLEIVLTAASADTTWSEGDFIIDDVNSNTGATFSLNENGNGIDITNLTFTNVHFDAKGTSNYPIVIYNPLEPQGANAVDGITFDGCTFTSYARVAASMTAALRIDANIEENYLHNLIVRDCTFNVRPLAFAFAGVPNFLIDSVKVTGAEMYAFNIPVTQSKQSLLGTDTYGVIQDSYFETTSPSAHTAVFGANLDNGNTIIVRRNRFVSPSTHGVAFKGPFHLIFEYNVIEVNGSGGKAIMYKGCQDCTVCNNYAYGQGAGIGGSDACSQNPNADWNNSNSTFYNNYVKVYGYFGHAMEFLDQACQLGGNEVDYNAYNISGSSSPSPFGILGEDTSLVTLAEAQAAWPGYAAEYVNNDQHSISADLLIDDPPADYTLPWNPSLYVIPWDSPGIDMGTPMSSITGNTVDFLGNPIYGAPDIGAYEYQPPYEMSTSGDPLATDAVISIYADGRYRYKQASSSAEIARLVVTPEGGSFGTGDYSTWMDLTIQNWTSANKSWTESSDTLENVTTSYTVGDLEAGHYYTASYNITGDDIIIDNLLTDQNGEIFFDYTGEYSTVTFNVDQSSPKAPADFDWDDHVDGDDLIVFMSCMTGPSVPHDGSPICQKADFDHDNDVDQSDFGILQRCYSGAVDPADPDCAN